MLDYETWMKVKEECRNEDMRPLCKLSSEAQTTMQEAHAAGAMTEQLGIDGSWIECPRPSWYLGNTYRVSPSWPGPAKPEPVVEYVDKDVFRQSGTIWVDNPYTCSARYPLATAASMEGFAGFIYELSDKDMCFAELILDAQTDGTWRVRVPKAVRFVKGAV